MTLGIDVGGTNLVLGLVQDGMVVRRVSKPWFPLEASLEQTLDILADQIDDILTPDTEKIGIGVPSVVDVKQGIVYDTANIPSWTEVPLKDLLEKRFQLPVSINNDANCYAMGVYEGYPSDARPEVLVVITLGTGVGIGVVDRGRLFCGANCGAGELGTLTYRGSTLEHYCSKQFFVENGWDSLSAARAASDGDPHALGLFDELGKQMGDLLCTVLFAYDPSHIALGGGIAYTYPYFQASMEARLRRDFPYRKSLERLTIDICTGDDIPVIGAARI
ncbi:MAG: ROK family protein [Bacteroidales bacterium]|nr:ROK family protein [Bacteroidales bacterium]